MLGAPDRPPRALDLAGPIHVALSDISRTLTPRRAFDPHQVARTLRIATVDLHQTALLPALVTRLRRDAPGLDLQVHAIERQRLHDQLATGELDLAIAPILVGSRDLRAEPLWKDHLVTLICDDHPLARPDLRSIRRRGLCRRCWPRPGDAGRTGNQPGRQYPGGARAAPPHRARAAKFRGVPSVVAATDLIATLPSRIVKDLAAIPGLLAVPAPLPPVEVSPHLFWHPRTQNSPLRSWLRAVIKETAARL